MASSHFLSVVVPRRMCWFFSFVLLSLFLVSCFRKSDPADGAVVIKIGSAAPLTGIIANLGKDCENGVVLAIEELNSQHLLLQGRPVKFEILSMDDQNDPKTATMVAQRLVDAKVSAVLGHLNSGTTIPASILYFRNQIPQLSPSSNPTYTARNMNTTFRIMATDAQQSAGLATYACQQLHAKTFVIIDDSSAYGQGLATGFLQSVRKLGGKVLSHEFVANNVNDFSAALIRVKSLQPDVLFFSGVDAQAAPMVNQMMRLGIHTRFLSGDMSCTSEFIKLAGSIPDFVYCSTNSLALSKMPHGEEFEKRYEKRFHKSVLLYAPYYYDGTMMVAHAILDAQSLNSQDILHRIHSTTYHGVAGTYDFEKNGDLKSIPVTIYTIKNNRLVVKKIMNG